MFLISLSLPAHAAKPSYYSVGAASVDITPDYPIRLSGYGGRQKESEGIDQRIFAQALAIGTDREGPALLLTVDNVAVPADIREELASRLAKKSRVRNERLTLCSTHTHTAPMLKNACPFLFGADIPPEHQQRIDRYTRELADKLEQVAFAALKDRKPAVAFPRANQCGFCLEPPAPGWPGGPRPSGNRGPGQVRQNPRHLGQLCLPLYHHGRHPQPHLR